MCIRDRCRARFGQSSGIWSNGALPWQGSSSVCRQFLHISQIASRNCCNYLGSTKLALPFVDFSRLIVLIHQWKDTLKEKDVILHFHLSQLFVLLQGYHTYHIFFSSHHIFLYIPIKWRDRCIIKVFLIRKVLKI